MQTKYRTWEANRNYISPSGVKSSLRDLQENACSSTRLILCQVRLNSYDRVSQPTPSHDTRPRSRSRPSSLLLIHFMTYLEKDKFSKMGVKTMRTSEAPSLQVFFCSNQAGGRRYARCRCHLSMFVSWKLASVCNLGRVKVQYHETLECTGSHWAHCENIVCSKPSNY